MMLTLYPLSQRKTCFTGTDVRLFTCPKDRHTRNINYRDGDALSCPTVRHRQAPRFWRIRNPGT